MKALKRSIALVLSVAMLFSGSITVFASDYAPQYATEANVLYQLDLFKGTGTNADGTPIFALEQKANRIQGLVMLIRLLGEEQDALAYTDSCPFTDVPAWAQKYAAYAFAKGYTKGTTATTFGADDALLGKAYLTFVLRALGYSDANGDFSYNNANAFAANLGLIAAGQCEGELLRDDCAMVSHSALRQRMKGTDTTLLDKLLTDGAVTEEAVQASGLVDKLVAVPYDKNKDSLDLKAVLKAIPEAASVVTWGSNFETFQHNTYAGRLSLLTNTYPVTDYLAGEIETLPALKPNASRTRIYNDPIRDKDTTTAITVLDKDYHLIAYCLVPFDYSDKTIYFTKCMFGGKEQIEQVRSRLANLPQIDSSAIYQEAVKTKYRDGSEKTDYYIRLDETKVSAELYEQFAYFIFGSSNRSNERLLAALQTSFEKNNLTAADSIWLYPNQTYKQGTLFILYDQNKNVIAYTEVPAQLPKVETVIQK